MQFNIKTTSAMNETCYDKLNVNYWWKQTNSELKLEPQFFAYLLSAPFPIPVGVANWLQKLQQDF